MVCAKMSWTMLNVQNVSIKMCQKMRSYDAVIEQKLFISDRNFSNNAPKDLAGNNSASV